MAQPILVERGQLAVELEVTKGTPVAPDAADAGIEIQNIRLEPTIEVAERNSVEPSFARRPFVPASRMWTITFEVPMKGSGAAGTVAEFSKLLEGCGMNEVIVAVTSVTYDPESANATNQTLTMDFLLDGVLWRLSGAMGNAIWVFSQNDDPVIRFEFKGLYNAATDTALLAGVSYGTVSPPNPVAATCTWDAEVLRLTAVEIDLGNEVVMRPDICAATGFLHAIIVDRATRITADPETELVATVDWVDEIIQGRLGAFAFALGGTGGNIHTFNAPNAQIVEAPFADRDGILVNNLVFAALANTDDGDDELNYVQT